MGGVGGLHSGLQVALSVHFQLQSGLSCTRGLEVVAEVSHRLRSEVILLHRDHRLFPIFPPHRQLFRCRLLSGFNHLLSIGLGRVIAKSSKD